MLLTRVHASFLWVTVSFWCILLIDTTILEVIIFNGVQITVAMWHHLILVVDRVLLLVTIVVIE